jgi:hypothetical protein
MPIAVHQPAGETEDTCLFSNPGAQRDNREGPLGPEERQLLGCLANAEAGDRALHLSQYILNMGILHLVKAGVAKSVRASGFSSAPVLPPPRDHRP